MGHSSKKIGRNNPCPCGSGKKYKKCCHDRVQAKSIPQLSPEQYAKVIKEFKRLEEQDKRYRAQYGDAKPIIHEDWNDKKVVAVGNTVYILPLDKTKTFHDFLSKFIKAELTPEWGNAEIAKPLKDRHPILQLYDVVCRRQKLGTKEPDGIYRQVMNGAQAAYYNLAHDLYTIQHNAKLKDRILERLKQREQFQGARYELVVASCLIRAGFDIEFEDESDGSSIHPEFIAVHRETGERLAVEAKSRHRPGMLGQPGTRQEDKDMRTRVGSLLNDALKKTSDIPFVVFIDVNKPPESAGTVFEKKWARDVMKRTPQLKKKNKHVKDPFNMIIFTNHPYHFGEERAPSPERDTLIVMAPEPICPFKNPSLLKIIGERIFQYGNIPKDFPKKNGY